MDNEEFCKKVLNLDQKIRFVAIYEQTKFYGKMREGVESYLNKIETDLSLNQALSRWNARLRLKDKIGKPHFSLTKYDKVYRATIGFKEGGLVCVTTEPDANILEIIPKIQQLISEGIANN